MWIVDYLISNPDRHLENWGFYYDPTTTDILGFQWEANGRVCQICQEAGGFSFFKGTAAFGFSDGTAL